MLHTLLFAATLSATPDYTVLVSRQTDADPAWHKVVEKLVAKHSATVVTYDGDVATAKDALAARMPLYTAIVAKPEELGRAFVAKTHRLMRRLDDDPYTDTLWGIVTGLSAGDALTLAGDDKPLVMKRAISTTGVNAPLFDQMFTVSDASEGAWTFKAADGTTTSGGAKDDAERKSDRAALFAQRFAEISPDVIVTSSHGFENGVEMPWGHGMLVGRNGELAILPQNPEKDGKPGKGLGKPQKFAATDNPKAFLPIGNCLVGNIDAKHAKNSLILALQRSAAVRQSIGYTIETWFGRAGWGTLGLLQSQPGNFTVAQAWFFNHQQLLEDLRTEYPKAAAFDYDWTDKSSVNSFFSAAQKAGITGKEKDEIGLAFDRDVVALYGDPKYDARLDASKWDAPFEVELMKTTGGVWQCRVRGRDPAKLAAFHGPAAIMLPFRCPDPVPIGTPPEGTILADNFLIIPDAGKAAAGKAAFDVRFIAKADRDFEQELNKLPGAR